MITHCINHMRTQLVGQGYYRLPLSNEEVFCFLKKAQNNLYIINLYNFEMYDNIRWMRGIDKFETDLYSYFVRYPVKRKFIVNIFIGDNRVESLYHILKNKPVNMDNEIMSFNWFADVESNKLLIPEQTPDKILGIEELLEGYLNNRSIVRECELKLKGRNTAKRIVFVMVAIYALIFFYLQIMFLGNTTQALPYIGLNSYKLFRQFEVWRIFTAMFSHIDSMQFLFNLIVLYLFGLLYERYVGWQFFIETFLMSGMIAGFVSGLVGRSLFNGDVHHLIYTVGATGALSGIVGGVLALLHRNKNPLGAMNSFVVYLYLFITVAYSSFQPTISMVDIFSGFITGYFLTKFIYLAHEKL